MKNKKRWSKKELELRVKYISCLYLVDCVFNVGPWRKNIDGFIGHDVRHIKSKYRSMKMFPFLEFVACLYEAHKDEIKPEDLIDIKIEVPTPTHVGAVHTADRTVFFSFDENYKVIEVFYIKTDDIATKCSDAIKDRIELLGQMIKESGFEMDDIIPLPFIRKLQKKKTNNRFRKLFSLWIN